MVKKGNKLVTRNNKMGRKTYAGSLKRRSPTDGQTGRIAPQNCRMKKARDVSYKQITVQRTLMKRSSLWELPGVNFLLSLPNTPFLFQDKEGILGLKRRWKRKSSVDPK